MSFVDEPPGIFIKLQQDEQPFYSADGKPGYSMWTMEKLIEDVPATQIDKIKIEEALYRADNIITSGFISPDRLEQISGAMTMLAMIKKELGLDK